MAQELHVTGLVASLCLLQESNAAVVLLSAVALLFDDSKLLNVHSLRSCYSVGTAVMSLNLEQVNPKKWKNSSFPNKV